MTGYQISGPLCLTRSENIDEGTLCRIRSPRPGAVGLSGKINVHGYVGESSSPFGNPFRGIANSKRVMTVYVNIWQAQAPYIAGSGSVGHVSIIDASGRTILSQFPLNRSIIEDNITRNNSDTLGYEGRSPESVYQVEISKPTAFYDAAKNQRNIKIWVSSPGTYGALTGSSSTNCVYAASAALQAGGVNVDSILPGNLGYQLDELSKKLGSGVIKTDKLIPFIFSVPSDLWDYANA